MKEKQAIELSKRYFDNFLENLPIEYDGVDRWKMPYENTCIFTIQQREYSDESNETFIKLGINLKHCFNKFSDCPIICWFPETEEDWVNLFEAMDRLRSDSMPEKCHVRGSYLDEKDQEMEELK